MSHTFVPGTAGCTVSVSARDVAVAAAPATGGFADQALDIARRIELITSHEPVVLDLTAPGCPVHAVQVVCPGTHSRIRRSMPR
ncbi:hypothetical protein [Streptomyces albogriseolus]|uniref:hypothetical protein n=1 Tax=Streptomyces albogriseolus TaxID=1887 RepID=UPI003CF180FF